MSLPKFLAGMFGPRRAPTSQQADADRATDAAKARATAVQKREDAAEAKVAADRAVEHARALAEARQREQSAREIRDAVNAVGFWWPRQTSGGRGLSARPNLRDKVAAIFEAWKSAR